MSKIAAIFPAFGCSYLGNEREILRGLGGEPDHYIERAADYAGLDAMAFAACRDGSFDSELQSQYAVYVYGAAVSRVLISGNVLSDYAAGYSMGLYAALHHAGSVSFETGLSMIGLAFDAIEAASAGREFGTGVISGLDRADLQAIVGTRADVEIVNENSEHGFLVSGNLDGVIRLLERSREEGALHARLLPFGSPYHSKFMDAAASEFAECLSRYEIEEPRMPIVSTIDQRLITTADEVRRDLVANIHHGINWNRSVRQMTILGVDTFIECGPGKSLCRMIRFIDPEASAVNLQNLHVMIGAHIPSRAGALSR